MGGYVLFRKTPLGTPELPGGAQLVPGDLVSDLIEIGRGAEVGGITAFF